MVLESLKRRFLLNSFMLIDSHTHLVEVANPKQVLQNARQKGVEWIVCNGVGFDSNQKNQVLCKSINGLWPCFGLHPKESLEQTPTKNQRTIDWIQHEFENNASCGLGETGVDFLVAKTPTQQQTQLEWFEKQLDLANQFSKCVTIHARSALKIALQTVQKKQTESCLFHWFDGTPDQLHTICDNGFLVSVGPAVLSQTKIQHVAQRVALENLVLETDCPVQFNQTPSEPAWIPLVAQKIAEIKQMPIEEIARQTTRNAVRFFNLPITDF